MRKKREKKKDLEELLAQGKAVDLAERKKKKKKSLTHLCDSGMLLHRPKPAEHFSFNFFFFFFFLPPLRFLSFLFFSFVFLLSFSNKEGKEKEGNGRHFRAAAKCGYTLYVFVFCMYQLKS